MATLHKSNSSPKEQAEFFMQDNNMKGKYLGECLDDCRWGSMTTVMYEMSIKEIIGFIQNWMQQNEENFEVLWNEEQLEEIYPEFELPFIYHEACPRDKQHSGVIRDRGGRLRCSHRSEQKFKPSFISYWDSFDKLSGMETRHFEEDKPYYRIPDDILDEEIGDLFPEYKKDLEQHQRELEKFEQEKSTGLVIDICYAILSDKGRILPLETIIKRLNLSPETETVHCETFGPCKRLDELSQEEKKEYDSNGRCHGHVQPYDEVEFSFDGRNLAFYVQKWYQQLPNGKAPIFEK